jgi:hypothetical protein
VEAIFSARVRTPLREAGSDERGRLATGAGESTGSVAEGMCSTELMRFSCRQAQIHRLPSGNGGYRLEKDPSNG